MEDKVNPAAPNDPKRLGSLAYIAGKKPVQKHVHFTEYELITKRVVLSGGGWDMLKQRRCKCGKVETYDLERYGDDTPHPQYK